MSVEFYKMSEIPSRAVRTYVLEDLDHPDGAVPLMLAVYRTMDYSDYGEEKRALAWLKDNHSPVHTFQVFPLTYIVFYDMADVLMFKLAVVNQD